MPEARGRGPFILAGNAKAAPTRTIRLADLDAPAGVVTKGVGGRAAEPPPPRRPLDGQRALADRVLRLLLPPEPVIVLLPEGPVVAAGQIELQLARAAGLTEYPCKVIDLTAPLPEDPRRCRDIDIDFPE